MTETANDAGSHPEGEALPEGQTEPADAPKSEQRDPNVTANGERLDRQTRNWRALERDRDHWREMAMRQSSQAPPPAAEAPRETTSKTLADFEYDEGKYQSYLFSEAQKHAVEAAKRELRAEQDRSAAERRVSTFRQRVTEFAKTVEDYESVVNDPSLPITAAMAEVIQDSDDGPALAYHLGKNPEVAARIAQLPPHAAARELGRLEARLEAERERAKEKPVVSKAPPPAPKIDGADPGAVKVRSDSAESDTLSDAEWMRLREKELKRKRG